MFDSNFYQAGIILLCLGCAIFGITEVPMEGIEFDYERFGVETAHQSAANTGPTPATGATIATPVYVPPPPPADLAGSQIEKASQANNPDSASSAPTVTILSQSNDAPIAGELQELD